jgi:hypothetical protein
MKHSPVMHFVERTDKNYCKGEVFNVIPTFMTVGFLCLRWLDFYGSRVTLLILNIICSKDMNSQKLHYKEQGWLAWTGNLDMRINK